MYYLRPVSFTTTCYHNLMYQKNLCIKLVQRLNSKEIRSFNESFVEYFNNNLRHTKLFSLQLVIPEYCEFSYLISESA